MLGPLPLHPVAQVGVVVTGYVACMALSGVMVRGGLRLAGPESTSHGASEAEERKQRTGRLIGKCENFLTVTLVLADEFAALAIIFTAKSYVRRQDIQKDAEYFLGGTLINVCWSVLVALVVKGLVFGLAWA